MMIGDDEKIKVMEYAEDLGDFSNVAKFIHYYGEDLHNSEDHDAKERYHALLKRSAQAFEYEKIHGVGSLLKLDREANQRLISSGLILAQEVEAAVRHGKRRDALISAQD